MGTEELSGNPGKILGGNLAMGLDPIQRGSRNTLSSLMLHCIWKPG